jgi:tetratricopeptide (TPR) repeat protein
MRGIREFLGCVACALLVGGVAQAAGEGQADLDAATQARAGTRADLEQVVKLCESALQKGLDEDNTSYAKQLLTATLLERANKYSAAIFKQKPPNPRWLQIKQLALKDLQKAVVHDDKLAPAYLLMARLHALPGGDRPAAFEAADMAVQLFVDDNKEKAKALALRGSVSSDAEQREGDFNAAVKTDPQSIDALRLRGIHFLAKKKYDEALRDLQQVIERNPEDMTALQAVAQAFTSTKKYDEAAEALGRIISLNPASPAGYILRARLNQVREDTEATLADLNKAIDIDTGNVVARMMRARILFDKRELEQAKDDVDRVIEKNPRVVEAILLRSLIFANDGKFAAAITDLKQVARAAPDNVPLQIQLAGLYNADDRPGKAIEIYGEILTADEDNGDALRGRGDAFLSQGKHAEAIADYDAALKLDAENSSLLNNFAWVLSTSPVDELRDAKRAIELAKKACELTEYKMPHILSTLASAYAESGDFETARKWSAKAVELGEGDMKEQLDQELESYKAEKPWRELKDAEEEPEPAPPREDDLFID